MKKMPSTIENCTQCPYYEKELLRSTLGFDRRFTCRLLWGYNNKKEHDHCSNFEYEIKNPYTIPEDCPLENAEKKD